MEADRSDRCRQAVVDALERGTPLRIVAGGTKAFYGRPAADATPLNIAGHRGILAYEPSELVLAARAGTPLAEIETLLAERGQMLAFEPPHFGPGATLGGAVATGLAGPRRPYAGSVRDSVLGCRVINGRGELLSFGGQVIKNVAGFDLSRLMAGAMGTLGVLLEVSLKVMPRPECERTLVFPMTGREALAAMSRWSGEPWPISALANDGSWTFLRLAGAEDAVAAAAARLGGDPAADGRGYWDRLKEQRGRFFRFPPLGERLWRLSVAPAAPALELPGHWLFDWGGAQRWLRSDASAEAVFREAARVGGHATLFRGEPADGRVFQPLAPNLLALHRNLKRAFDPQGIFNPGRIYEDF